MAIYQCDVARLIQYHGKAALYCRLNTEITVDDALTGLIDRVCGASPDGALNVTVAICAKLHADPKNGRKPCCNKDAVPVVIGVDQN